MPLPLPSRDPAPLPAGLYSTDAFHRRPLFVVEPEKATGTLPAPVVRSWEEAHALHGPARISDVNPAYVAALISHRPDAQVAPYRRIRRLPRSHQVLIAADGTLHTSAYDPLAGGAGAMEATTLHAFLRQGLLDHLERALDGHGGAIGCEHSSGLDSNAVLGALVHGLGIETQRIHTWSRENHGEGPFLKDFRPFFGLLPQRCHTSTEHAGQSESNDDPLPVQLGWFGAPPQSHIEPLAECWLRQQGCSVLFSGFGGDQALSHHAANVPTDLVAQGRWQELVRWEGGRRRALKTAAGRALALASRPWAENKVLRRASSCAGIDYLERSLTEEGRSWLGPYLQQSYPWELDQYLPLHHSIRRRVLADGVAVRVEEETRTAAVNGMSKAFPLLDEFLIATLLQQDPGLFGEAAGRGRLLHRLAFAPFLPPFLRDNPAKGRPRQDDPDQRIAPGVRALMAFVERRLVASKSWHPELSHYWDLETIHRQSSNILQSAEPSPWEILPIGIALNTLHKLSSWWQALEG